MLRKKGFTLIELIIVIAIIGILAGIAIPISKGHTKEANLSKHLSYVKELESASERYYMVNSEWPRLGDDPLTSEELETYTERIRDIAGKEVKLEPEGKYYEINYKELSKYTKLPEYKENYILQNPVGRIYYLENLTEIGSTRLKPRENEEPKEPEEPEDTTEYTGVITWNLSDKDSAIVLHSENLGAHNTSFTHANVRATEGKTSGKWYWETTTLEASGARAVGVSDSSEIGMNAGYRSPKSIRYYNWSAHYTGMLLDGMTENLWYPKTEINDVLGVMLDMDNKIIEFRKNNILVYKGSIAHLIDTEAYAIAELCTANIVTNFGATPFKYEIPEGYLPYQYTK